MLPTIPQMRARSENAHEIILRSVKAGEPYVKPSTRDSAWRGFRTARSTLVRWGCLEAVRGQDENGRTIYSDRITERGLALLAEYDARDAATSALLRALRAA